MPEDRTGRWVLRIRALPSAQTASGTLTIDLPDEPRAPEPEPEVAPAPAPPPPPEPWTVAAAAPSGATPRTARLHAAVEALRASVVRDGGDTAPDACGWRVSLLRSATAYRDAAAASSRALPRSDADLLRLIVQAVGRVAALRPGGDPDLAGPAPVDPLARKLWLQSRREKLAPIVADLDALAERAAAPLAPPLGPSPWPVRLVSCLTACERSFERAALAAPDEEIPYAELARSQWDTILLAAEVLRAALPDPAAPAGSP